MLRYFALLLVLAAPAAAMAQNGVCSEGAVRAIIRSGKITTTDDSFFWSGAYDKPLIGNAEQKKSRMTADREEPRKNFASSMHAQKIDASSSGDMAYEYGTGKVAYDEGKTGKHTSFDIGYLRVWKAVGGQCRVAAEMYRPIESTIQSK